jgi:hypothetical protein
MRLRHLFVRLELLAIYPKYLISILDFLISLLFLVIVLSI